MHQRAQRKSRLAVKQQQGRSLPEEDVVGAACLGAAFLGDSDLLANWEPTELSKNPPPEEAFVGEDCLGAGAAFLGDSLLVANWAPTEVSKNPFEAPATQSLFRFTFNRCQKGTLNNDFLQPQHRPHVS